MRSQQEQSFLDFQQKNWPWEGGTRNCGLIYSPLIKNQQRVYNGYFHTSDILPTLASAAGIKIGPVDGFDQWKSLVDDKDSPRTELVTTLDNHDRFASIIDGNWKLVNGTTFGGVFDGHLGGIEEFKMSPTTYTNAVLSSTVAKTLSSLEKQPAPLSEATINRLRSSLKINCKAANNPVVSCNPLVAPCLFNINADPCELKNLASVYPQKVNKLVQRMNDMSRSAVPTRRTFVSEPLCDPQLHLGAWSWWVADSM